MRKRNGFTFTELIVVVGVITVLVSLIAPVVSKARSAARAACCASHLQQLGTAWTLYMMENNSALVPYMWHTVNPHQAYDSYWFGILDHYAVKGQALLCPAADSPFLMEPSAAPNPSDPSFTLAHRQGFGGANFAWTGRYDPNGTAIRLTKTIYRDGSYGYNRYLTQGGFGTGESGTSLLGIKNLQNVPVFMDCVFADVRPDPPIPNVTPKLPKDFSGMESTPATPDLWKLLIARHGRAINVCLADGSVRRVPLSEIETLQWNALWQKTTLLLP